MYLNSKKPMNSIIQPFSYHTHTTFSDGFHSIEEMLEQAVKLGWEEIGISDHMIIHENIKYSYSWPRFTKYFGRVYFDNFEMAYEIASRNIEHIRKIAKSFPLQVYIGYEVDFFNYSGWFEKIIKLRSKLDINYLISGNHFVEDDNERTIVSAVNFYEKISDVTERRLLLRNHYATIVKAIKSKLFDFVAHVDLLRGFNECDENGFKDSYRNIINALVEMQMPFELSTKGLRKSNDFYPTHEMLKQLCHRKVPVVISDDAHNINELGYCFDKAEKLLSEFGCTNRWRLQVK